MLYPFDLASQRRFYAEELRVVAPVLHHDSVVEAFATVPREQFAGPGPWLILPPHRMESAFRTANADPRWLYHDVLFSIDQTRGLNNGQPSLWARLLDCLDWAKGQRVLQVGAGSGYYSAIMAELVGSAGHVAAVEYDEGLAALAMANLVGWPQVGVIHGDGTIHDPGEVDSVVVFAGATQPAPFWLDRLCEGGNLLLPLTSTNGRGFILKATRRGDSFEATSLGPCGFYPCIGARDDAAANRLAHAMKELKGASIPVKALHVGRLPEATDEAWYAGSGFWLSKTPLHS